MDARTRLRRALRDPAADPATVALQTIAFHERDLDIPAVLLRIDALADLVRTTDGAGTPSDPPSSPEEVVERCRAVLGDRLGYRADNGHTRTHTDAYLHVVLDRHAGLPVTLSALYASVARRLGVPAYVVNLPGHVVAAAPDGDRAILFDPFHGGRVLDEADADALVHRATGGEASFRRSMVRPATSTELARRILTNLTVDLTRELHAGAAVWTAVAKLALPDSEPHDHLVLASLLERSGRFVRAAQAYDRYLAEVPDADDADEVRARARMARARTTDVADQRTHEMRIDELAVEAGVTSRTVRDYQARGLLPPPRLEGRTGWYSREHLARLELIADLQERGFSLAAVKATLDAWAQGNDLQGLLDLEQLLLAPWGDPEHQAREMPVTELLERFQFLDDLPGAIQKAVDSGLLEPREDRFLAPAPVILEAAEELLRLGMDLDDLLDLLAATQEDTERIARRYVERVAPSVLAQLEGDGVGAALETVRRLRPLALGSVRAVLDAELRRAIDDRMRQLGIDIEAQGVTGLRPD